MEIKEEFTSKINDLSDKYEIERQKLKNEGISSLRKLETV